MDKSGATINSFEFEKETRHHNSIISHNVNGTCMAQVYNERFTCMYSMCLFIVQTPVADIRT